MVAEKHGYNYCGVWMGVYELISIQGSVQELP